MFLSWGWALLHGLSQSPCRTPLDVRPLSWGSLPLQRSRSSASTSARPSCPDRCGPPSFHPGVCQQVPTCQLRCHSQGFSPSQRLAPPVPSHHFQMGRVLGVLPFRGLFLSRRRSDSSSLPCPLDVAPAECACPIPRWGLVRHACRCLGCADTHLSSSTGLRAAGESICIVAMF